VTRGWSGTTPPPTRRERSTRSSASRPSNTRASGRHLPGPHPQAELRRAPGTQRGAVDGGHPALPGRVHPGIRDELEYQFHRRTEELLRLWNKTFIYGRPYAGSNGSPLVSGGDFSSLAGVYAWLDGTWNTTINASSTTTYNWNTQGWGAGQVDAAVNFANLFVQRQGAMPDTALWGFNTAQAASRLYRDLIRIEQSENERGFVVDHMITPLGNRIQFVLDGKVDDAPGIATLFLLDVDRIRIRPFYGGWFYAFTAPTLNDGDAFRRSRSARWRCGTPPTTAARRTSWSPTERWLRP